MFISTEMVRAVLFRTGTSLREFHIAGAICQTQETCALHDHAAMNSPRYAAAPDESGESD
jgi:hypothetical protein